MRALFAKICQAVVCLLFIRTLAVAAEGPSGVGEVKVKADNISYDKGKELINARGNVEIQWGSYTLLSDSALVRQGENEAVAEGKVSLLKGGDILKSDRISLNYVTGLGEADNGYLFIKQRNFHLYGDRFLKTGKEDYRLERGTFTTCDGPEPSWRFTASNLDVTVEDYARGRNAVFYVGKVPVFYTPYISFPLMRERQSGFLIPRIGTSTMKGFYLDIPYYWAISPSQDVTVDLDGQTNRGLGFGLDYRYLRPRGSDGELKGYLIYDTQLNRERGYVMSKAREFISPSLSFIADVNLTLDRNFFQDYGEASGDYNRQLLDTTAFLTKNGSKDTFVAEIRYVDNLYTSNNGATLQRLPTLTYSHVRSQLGKTPLSAGLDAGFTNFYRDDGIRGQRLILHPTLAVSHPIVPGVDLSAWGGYVQRLYNGYGGDPGQEGYHGDGLFDAGAVMSSSLARIYAVDGESMRAVRHTLIPEIGYSFVQEKNQERLPFFDFDDRILGQEMVTWSLTNFVTGKYLHPGDAPLYRDLLYLRLSQGYQLRGARRDLLTLVDDGLPFTDIRVEARYSPVKILTVTTDSRYNPYRTHFSTASAGLDLDDTEGDMAGLSYHFARDQVDYLEGKAALSLVKPFVFKYNFRYSVDKGGFLESLYSAEYKRQCWSVIFSYQQRLLDRAFMVSFTLAGVGAVRPMKTF